jgi:ribose transport system ATP-binding protein
MSAPRFTMSGVSKRFGGTQALDDVSLTVHSGEVHALIGENGAGKSSLMKVLAGIHPPDAGAMTLADRPYRPGGPAEARRTGVAMIHQELSLAPHLSVEANILLGREVARLGVVRRAEHRSIARAALARLGQGELPLEMPVANLPIAAQQLVEIARALVSDAQVMVFDEPTSSLTEADSRKLFQVIRELRASGLGIVYISHFLEEVAEIGDRYTVLRDGRVVATGDLRETTPDEIVRAMVGRQLGELFPTSRRSPGEVMLDVKGLSGQTQPKEVAFDLRAGEIFGLAGLVGAGRSELVRCLYGLEPITTGKVTLALHGKLAGGPREHIARGVGLVSEDRKVEGLAVQLSIADNLTMSRLSPFSRCGWLNLGARSRDVAGWLKRLDCKATGPDQAIDQLSGGNQQKVAIARLLHQGADVLLLDEPTRGIDIGAKAQIYRLLGELAAAGKGIIMVSSYLPELLHVCDRIGVMCRGRLREVRDAAAWDAESIMHCATGREATVACP